MKSPGSSRQHVGPWGCQAQVGKWQDKLQGGLSTIMIHDANIEYEEEHYELLASTHLKSMLVKLNHIHKCRQTWKKHLKPPPSKKNITPWKFNIAPGKSCLEDSFPFGAGNFSGAMLNFRSVWKCKVRVQARSAKKVPWFCHYLKPLIFC